MPIKSMGKFTAIGMRTKVDEDEHPNALVINTCGRNDTDEIGTATSWVWCNPTNRVLTHPYEDIEAVSVEALWQGTKLLPGQERPDPEIIGGAWRKNKGRKPAGAYAGPGKPLICTPGAARRAIYLPAFRRLIEHGLENETIAGWVAEAYGHDGPVFLRDHDTGRGLDQNGPMSHAWLLCDWLNNEYDLEG